MIECGVLFFVWSRSVVPCLLLAHLNPVYTLQPVVKPVVQPVWQQAVSCKQTSNWLSNWFLTTGWMFVCTIQPVVNPVVKRIWTVLNEQPLFVQPVVKPGYTTGLTAGCIHDTAVCQTGCQTGLTTGCIVYTNIYPVVKPVWQQVVSCKRGFTARLMLLLCLKLRLLVLVQLNTMCLFESSMLWCMPTITVITSWPVMTHFVSCKSK